MLFEITRDRLFFQAISRTGHTVDAGSLRQQPVMLEPVGVNSRITNHE